MLRVVYSKQVMKMAVNSRSLAAAASDPLQQMYLDKIKEYSVKAKSGSVPKDAALAAKFNEDKLKLKDIYSRNPYDAETPDDCTKMTPTFNFKEPNLRDIY